MSLFRKISIFSKKITEKAKNYSADELIADSIIKAAKKKEKVNVILQEKNSLYRISHLELDIDFPPSVVFKISKLQEDKKLIQTAKENNALVETEI
jgi:predicted nucleic acid-binding protein